MTGRTGRTVPNAVEPRPAALTRERAVEAAVRIGDEQSLEALTMRRLAAELGVGTMTLYSYFDNKNELLDGIADHILGSMILPPLDGVETADALRLIAHSLRNMMHAHPSIVRLFTSRTTRSPRAMKGSYEQPLQALLNLGFDKVAAVRVYGLLLTYAIGFAAYELPRPWGRRRSEVDGVEELRRQRRHFYQALPRQEFPSLVDLSGTLVSLPSDEQFGWGLDVLIAGLLATSGIDAAAGKN
jgi:AcrR family transcriptional regulator